MLLRDLFVKRKPRTFSFTPFYYKEAKVRENSPDTPRIQFKRIRTTMSAGKRSIRSMVLLAILLVAMLIYFWQLVEKDLSTSELEKIKIEEIQSGY